LTQRAVGSLLLAMLLLVMTAASVSAKLDATLSPVQARPGDIVTLTTGPGSEGVSQGVVTGDPRQPVPVYLLAATDASNQSCPFWDAASATGAGATLLGSLAWDHATGVGTLAFKVPDVPPGSHAIAVLAPNASPGCWPEAMLTVVGAAVPDAANHPPAADLRWLVLVAAAGIGALVGGLWRRRRASLP